MQDFIQFGLLCVSIEILGVKPLHINVSSNDFTKLDELELNRLKLKSPNMKTFSQLLKDDMILDNDSLKLLAFPPGGR